MLSIVAPYERNVVMHVLESWENTVHHQRLPLSPPLSDLPRFYGLACLAAIHCELNQTGGASYASGSTSWMGQKGAKLTALEAYRVPNDGKKEAS
jgi:hypothetical protein